jgi:hypothetical protein
MSRPCQRSRDPNRGFRNRARNESPGRGIRASELHDGRELARNESRKSRALAGKRAVETSRGSEADAARRHASEESRSGESASRGRDETNRLAAKSRGKLGVSVMLLLRQKIKTRKT